MQNMINPGANNAQPMKEEAGEPSSSMSMGLMGLRQRKEMEDWILSICLLSPFLLPSPFFSHSSLTSSLDWIDSEAYKSFFFYGLDLFWSFKSFTKSFKSGTNGIVFVEACLLENLPDYVLTESSTIVKVKN